MRIQPDVKYYKRFSFGSLTCLLDPLIGTALQAHVVSKQNTSIDKTENLVILLAVTASVRVSLEIATLEKCHPAKVETSNRNVLGRS